MTLESTPGFSIVSMHTTIRSLVAVFLAVSVQSVARAQHPAMPPGMTHEQHMAQMQKDAELKKRGAAAMGFDQEKTTHHFRLRADGGAIEVTANDAADAATIGAVRRHLKQIAEEFAKGDFGKPLATHGEEPPGVATMRERRDAVAFRYEDDTSGGRVRMTTADARALAAIHEFLRYQIAEHKTGDPLVVER